MERIKSIIKHTDWVLLIFLFLVANHAMFTLKLIGLAFIYILRPNLKFGFFKGRIPKFYLYIVLLALINLFFHVREFSNEYLTAFAIGNSFWIFGLLIHHQLRLSIEKNGDKVAESTMKAFVLCNVAFCLFQLGRIIAITHTLDPYVDLPFPYGMSTGDKIYGFFMENSYYNMMVSAMVSVYFLYRKNIFFSSLSAICMLMVFGNVGTVVFLAVLLGIVGVTLLNKFSNNSSGTFSYIVNNLAVSPKMLMSVPLLVLLVAFFYLVVSYPNAVYFFNKFKGEGNKEAITPTYFIDSISASGNDIEENVAITRIALHELRGKKLSFTETIDHLGSSPATLLLGAGTTRFSSVTAQRMSGLDSSRLFSKVLPRYCSPLYRDNHRLITFLRLQSSDAELSNANWPDSFYNQIFGEYGILGFIVFLIFYVWYFLKDLRYWTYTFWLSIMLIPFALLSYMFEPLCVMVFFEFLAITDIINNKKIADES